MKVVFLFLTIVVAAHAIHDLQARGGGVSAACARALKQANLELTGCPVIFDKCEKCAHCEWKMGRCQGKPGATPPSGGGDDGPKGKKVAPSAGDRTAGGDGGGGGGQVTSSSDDLSALCSKLSQFMDSFTAQRTQWKTNTATLDATTKAWSKTAESTLDKNQQGIVAMINRFQDTQTRMSTAERSVVTIKGDIETVQNDIEKQRAEATAQIKVIQADAEAGKKELTQVEKQLKEAETKNAERFGGDFFLKIETKLSKCLTDQKDLSDTKAEYKALMSKQETIEKTLTSQIGSLKFETKKVNTGFSSSGTIIAGRLAVQATATGKTETMVTGKLGMVATNMQIQVNGLAAKLMAEKKRPDVTAKMMEEANQAHEDTVKQVKGVLDNMAKEQRARMNLRFRGHAHLKASRALHKSMQAIASHVAKHAARLDKARQGLGLHLCDSEAECSSLGFESIAAFKERVTKVTETYSKFYTELCTLRTEYNKKLAEKDALEKQYDSRYQAQKKQWDVLAADIAKFESEIDTVTKEYQLLVEKYNLLIKTFNKDAAEFDAAKEDIKSKLVITRQKISGIMQSISTISSMYTANVAREREIIAKNKKCAAESSTFEAEIKAMEDEAMKMVTFQTSTNAQFNAYCKKVEDEEQAMQSAAEYLNKARDVLVDEKTKLNVATLSARNFSPRGSGRINSGSGR